MENVNIEKEEFERMFDVELKNYLSLENSIFEIMEIYKSNPDEKLKGVITKLIHTASNDIYHLLQLIANYFTGEVKIQFSNNLGSKLNNLHEMEKELFDKVR